MEDKKIKDMPMPVCTPEFHDGNNWFSIATEAYVQNQISAGKKQYVLKPCIVATTTGLVAEYTSAGESGVGDFLQGENETLMIDGRTCSVQDRILVKNQENLATYQNGIYVVEDAGSTVSPWKLVRATDFDTADKVIQGTVVNIIYGTTNFTTSWMSYDTVQTVGVNNIEFAKMSSGGSTGTGIHSVSGTIGQITVTPTSTGPDVTLSFANNATFTGDYIGVPVGSGATGVQGSFRLNPNVMRRA